MLPDQNNISILLGQMVEFIYVEETAWGYESKLPAKCFANWCWLCNGVECVLFALTKSKWNQSWQVWNTQILLTKLLHFFMFAMFPAGDYFFQQFSANPHSAPLIWNCFLEYASDFQLLCCSLHSLDLNLIKHVCHILQTLLNSW